MGSVNTQGSGYRIARNTLALYLRMLISMLVSLYTSRVVLSALGVEDYGIYNVVTGFVLAFGFLNSAMHVSVQRFLTMEFEKHDFRRLNHIFSLSLVLHVAIALTMVVITETVGLYFLENRMVIPPDRMNAARWVFHFSVVSLFFSILNVPYRALIITYEHMGSFAVISLFEVFAKLGIALVLPFMKTDRLLIYGLMLAAVSVVLQIIYIAVCKIRYQEASFHKYVWDRLLLKDMCSFAGWNLIGVFAGIAQNQGVNVVLNIFGGPVVNAARAISFQVGGAANQLVTNFQLAVTPPLMKQYANRDGSAEALIFSSSKISCILIMFVIVPVYVMCPEILSLWLETVPEHAVAFTRIVLLDSLVGSLAGPLHTLFQATGKISRYQMVISGILLLNLPLAYIMLHYGCSYDSVFALAVVLTFVTLICRLVMIRKYADVNVRNFTLKVIIPCTLLAAVVYAITCGAAALGDRSLADVFIVTSVSAMSIVVFAWIFALTGDEKALVKSILRRR